MTKVRLKYLHCFTDRHGKPHCYFRYRGEQWRLPAPGTEGFATAYDALLAGIKVRHNNVEFMPGSLDWAIEKFLASPLYNKRAETTKRNYRRVLDCLRQGWGAGFLRDLQPRHVRTIRNEIAKRSTTDADIGMSLIRHCGNLQLSNLESSLMPIRHMASSGFIRLPMNMNRGRQS